ncbi:MAG: Rieske 2Fe-2S domain-containing protein [Nitrospinae bacterium]|nr:Rieske 2Fe-2S domain-containing protein [Nitrospinota bacterium]
MLDIDSQHKGLAVAWADEISHGNSRKFILRCGSKSIDGFVVNFKGHFYAYVNRCCHIPMALDWYENEFFTKDKRFILCPTHGAAYEPNTGLCIDGPCPGEYLETIPVAVKHGQIVVYCPPAWD